jgi:hypothetical protein
MTPAEITERQLKRVRALTNMTDEQISNAFLMELLKTMYPAEAAHYIVNVLCQAKGYRDRAKSNG